MRLTQWPALCTTMGRGQTTQERRKKEKSCQKAAEKPQWRILTTHTHTHTHTLPPAMEPGSAASSCSAAPTSWPQGQFCSQILYKLPPVLLLTPTAPRLPHHCLVMVRVSLPPVWRTGDDCLHPNLGTQVLQGKGMAEATPALPSRWQQLPISAIWWARTATCSLPACKMETPNCAWA